MLRNEIIELMEKLKLRGMQSVYDEALSDGRKSRSTPEKVILEMLKAEVAERHICRGRCDNVPEMAVKSVPPGR
jgi:hypothetical protein